MKKESGLHVLFLDRWASAGLPLSNDGKRYFAMGGGDRVCFPFQFRWLIPFVCKQVPRRWKIVSDLSTLLLVPLMCCVLFLLGVSPVGCIFGGLSVVGLFGVFQFNRNNPVLVGAPAMCLTLLSYIFFLLGGDWYYGFLAAAVLAGCVKESSCLYLFGLTLDPLSVVGLASPLITRLVLRGGKDPLGDDMPGIAFPFSSAQRFQRWSCPRTMILPWGGLLSALLFPSLSLIVSLFLSYGPLIRVTDTLRVYQWGWMAMVVTAYTNLPEYAIILVTLLTLYNPFRK